MTFPLVQTTERPGMYMGRRLSLAERAIKALKAILNMCYQYFRGIAKQGV